MKARLRLCLYVSGIDEIGFVSEAVTVRFQQSKLESSIEQCQTLKMLAVPFGKLRSALLLWDASSPALSQEDQLANTMIPSVWRTSSPSSFTKQFELSVEDHLAVRYARKEPLPFGRFAGFVTLCSLFVGLIVAHRWWKSGDPWMAACIAAVSLVIGLLLAKLLYGFIKEQVWGFWIGFLNAREAINIPLEMTIDVNGVHVLVRQQTWFCPWESLDTVEEDAERYYFWTSGTQTHILPKRLFEDENEAASFAAALRTWWRQEPISPPRRAGTKHLDWGNKS